MRFREVISQAEMLEERLALYNERREQTQENMTLIDRSDDELQSMHDAAPAENERHKATIDDVITAVSALKSERGALAKRQEELLEERGQLRAAKEMHDRALRTGLEAVRTMAVAHGFDLPGSADDFMALAKSTSSQLAASLKREEASLQSSTARCSETESQLSRESQRLRNEMHDHQAARDHKREAAQRVQKRIDESKREAHGLEDMHVLESRCAEIRARFDKQREELSASGLEQKMADRSASILTLSDQREALLMGLACSNEEVEQRASLAHKERDVQCTAQQLDGLLRDNAHKAQRWLGADADPQRYAALCTQRLHETEARVAEQEKRVGSLRSNVDKLQAESDVREQQIAAKEAQQKELGRAIKEILGDDYASPKEAVNAAQEEVSIVTDSLAVLEHAAEFFQRILRQGQDKHVCLGCNRGIASEYMPAFEAHVKASLARSQPEHAKALREDLDAWNTQLAQYREADNLQRRLDHVSDSELPALHQARQPVQLRAARRELDEVQAVSRKASADADEVRALHAFAGQIQSTAIALATMQRELEDSRLEARGSDSATNSDDTRANLARINAELCVLCLSLN